MNNVDLKEIWPDWKIEKQIGIGSFGSVYKAVCSRYGVVSNAAVKVISIPSDITEVEALKYEGMSESETRTYFKSVVDSLVGEINVMETLKGASNIVCIEDYKVIEKKDTIGWDIFIRMELLTKLNDYMCDKEVSEADVIDLGIALCNALEICRKKNIIHRDIKPENIFVNEFGEYKLGDFGVAKKLEYLNSTLSQKGTYGYMAPEVVKNMKYDSRVDIYSLGLVMYKLMNNNRLPFLSPNKQILNHTERQMAVERRIRGEQLLPPVNASMELAHVILKACEYEVNNRYKSASEMKEALQKLKFGNSNSNENFDGYDYRDNYYGDGYADNGFDNQNYNYDGNAYYNDSYSENGYTGNYYDGNSNSGNDFAGGGYGNDSYGNNDKGYYEEINPGYCYQNNDNAEKSNRGYATKSENRNVGILSTSAKPGKPPVEENNENALVKESPNLLPAKKTKFRNILTHRDCVIIALATGFFVGIIFLTLAVFSSKSNSIIDEINEIMPTQIEMNQDNHSLAERSSFVFLSDNEQNFHIKYYVSLDASEVYSEEYIPDTQYNIKVSELQDAKARFDKGNYQSGFDLLNRVLNTKGFFVKYVTENGDVRFYKDIYPDIPGDTSEGPRGILSLNLDDKTCVSYVGNSGFVFNQADGTDWQEFMKNAEYCVVSNVNDNFNSGNENLGREYYYFNKNNEFISSIESKK